MLWFAWRHNHPKVKAWLAKHPRFELHFTPTSSSWTANTDTILEKVRRGRVTLDAIAS